VYHAVLLDVFGTLVRDDGAGLAAVAEEVAARAGAAPAEVERDWETRLWRMADSAYGPGFRTLAELNAESLAETADHFGVRVDARELCDAAVDRQPPLFPDALPFLAAVGVPVCLVSDADRDHLHAVLELHGITVEHVVTSEDARAYKPRPEPFRLALGLVGRSAAEVVHVGDSPAADLAGAAALNIAAAFVNRGGHPVPASARPAHTAATLTDLSFLSS
jgi:HAD superfamily hydrolase (TIGR01493 family)